MAMSHHVDASMRLVRVLALTGALSMLCVFVAVQAFMAQYGAPTRQLVVGTSTDPALQAAVARQEAAGRECSEEPVLTDVVLYQRARGARVVTVSFAEAVERAAAHEGWIRSYCVGPSDAGP